jgi:Glycine zipper 2TM domain
MRTVLLVSIAAAAVVIGDTAHAGQDKAAEAAAAAREAVDAAGGKPAPGAAEHGVTYETETRVVRSTAAQAPVHSEVRTEATRIIAADARGPVAPTGQGEWVCTQDTPDAREYRCRFDGELRAADSAHGAWRDMDDYDWSDAQWAEEEASRRDLERACRPDNGIGGSLLGGLLGGFAGNRIAGRGNRTAGTLLGGALGAVAGGLIDQAEDKSKCRDMVRRVEERQRGWHGGGGGQWQTGYAHGYGQGWYSPGVMVVTTVSQPVITETVTTTTHYETVSVPRKRHAHKKRHYKPKPKPRCGC